MLQQTQVDRVLPKYQAFLKTFPTLSRLAHAPLADVLRAWQGLGYNRRAKALHEAVRILVQSYKGKIPRDPSILRTLPGIGPYTAEAVCVFAFNQHHVLLETNIRTVLLHHLLPNRVRVRDEELREYAEKLADKKRPREWNWALMDYGSYLKRNGVRINNRAHTYTRQSSFKGSLREVRGAILKKLSARKSLSYTTCTKTLPFSKERIRHAVTSLTKDGLVRVTGQSIRLP